MEVETARNTGIHDIDAISYDDMGRYADLAIIVGGDGTMIGAARKLACSGIPLIGINHGRLGFITDIPLADAHDAIISVINGNYEAEERSMLEGRIVRGNETLISSIALNDIVINRAGRGGMIELRVELDGVFMHRQRADGVIISTPTGSTAYALAANGPILHPALNAILLVPVAPQTLSNRPVVVPDSSTLSLTITTLGRVESGASVHFDMQTWSDCQPVIVLMCVPPKKPYALFTPQATASFPRYARSLTGIACPYPQTKTINTQLYAAFSEHP